MRLHLCLADYNQSVLELATAPNLFLAWYTNKRSDSSNEVEITPELLARFKDDLATYNISVSAISGSWGVDFDNLAQTLLEDRARSRLVEEPTRTLILASETIYSLKSIHAFASTALGLLNLSYNSVQNSKVMVAAKKVYFGVGGGVDEFMKALQGTRGKARVVWETEGAGVGRVILDVVRDAI